MTPELLAHSAQVESMGDDVWAISQGRSTPLLVRDALDMRQMATKALVHKHLSDVLMLARRYVRTVIDFYEVLV